MVVQDLNKDKASSELEIVVELGNLVPRNKVALQKLFVAFIYSQSYKAKYF